MITCVYVCTYVCKSILGIVLMCCLQASGIIIYLLKQATIYVCKLICCCWYRCAWYHKEACSSYVFLSDKFCSSKSVWPIIILMIIFLKARFNPNSKWFAISAAHSQYI